MEKPQVHAGFTGTRKGMTLWQRQRLALELRAHRVTDLHHGDCIGADTEAWSIAQTLGIRTHSHPPENPEERAYTINDTTAPVKPYLDRNADIAAVGTLFAAPADMTEQARGSGTWATVRYARRRKKLVVLLNPNQEDA